MFGWTLIRNTEISLQKQLAEARISALQQELQAAKEYSAKCERLLDHERARIDAERERADRIADSLFQQQGLPATSATVLSEQKHEAFLAAEKHENYLKELSEIYNESMDEMVEDGAEPVPEELLDVVKA